LFGLACISVFGRCIELSQAVVSVGAFFNSFRKGPVVCRGLDLDLSGKMAKKRLWHGKEVATPTMGHFTFWLRPWLSLLAEPKTTLSWRWAKKWSRIFRLVSAVAQTELLAQPRLRL